MKKEQLKKIAIAKQVDSSLIPKHKQIIQQLITSVRQENEETRMYAIHILGKMCEDACEAIPYIFPHLQDNNEKMVAIAATALGNMGDQRVYHILEKICDFSSMLSAKKALKNLKEKRQNKQ